MPGTVDDFIQRFGGQQTMDDREASQYLDRFASDHPQDRDFDNHALSSGATEYLGKLPDAHFEDAARTAYAGAAPAQQQGLIGSLMRALQNRGVNPASLGGFGSGGVPSNVNPDQYARVANAVRQQYPDAMQEVVREQPWFVKAMGNPILMGALGVVASRMMRNRNNPAPTQSSGGLLGKLF